MARAATRTGLTTRFPFFGNEGGYESFYVRAVDPERPRSVWLRHTVLQEPGGDPVGSAWVTVFDGARPAPLAYKSSAPDPEPEGWLRVGPSDFEPDGVRGATPDGAASWDLTWTGDEPGLRHLPKSIMYSAPLPRTKLESPRPAVHVSGRVSVAGVTTEVDAWPGMVGHNWGAQHAERWIWLHGTLFDGRPVSLNEAQFRRHLQHDGIPLLVDFWASWCGPCHAMAPQFEAAAKLLEPWMRLAKVSTEEAAALAQALGIASIPTLALFAGGREVARQSGALPAQRIVEWAKAAAR